MNSCLKIEYGSFNDLSSFHIFMFFQYNCSHFRASSVSLVVQFVGLLYQGALETSVFRHPDHFAHSCEEWFAFPVRGSAKGLGHFVNL